MVAEVSTVRAADDRECAGFERPGRVFFIGPRGECRRSTDPEHETAGEYRPQANQPVPSLPQHK